ncbi:hypothetical protein HI914_02294 [Erysiphe necator]|nr:hypothetical protein HI914_02294 [Erysiphe necator]
MKEVLQKDSNISDLPPYSKKLVHISLKKPHRILQICYQDLQVSSRDTALWLAFACANDVQICSESQRFLFSKLFLVVQSLARKIMQSECWEHLHNAVAVKS